MLVHGQRCQDGVQPNGSICVSRWKICERTGASRMRPATERSESTTAFGATARQHTAVPYSFPFEFKKRPLLYGCFTWILKLIHYNSKLLTAHHLLLLRCIGCKRGGEDGPPLVLPQGSHQGGRRGHRRKVTMRTRRFTLRDSHSPCAHGRQHARRLLCWEGWRWAKCTREGKCLTS